MSQSSRGPPRNRKPTDKAAEAGNVPGLRKHNISIELDVALVEPPRVSVVANLATPSNAFPTEGSVGLMSLPLPTAGEQAAQGSILLGNIAAKEDAPLCSGLARRPRRSPGKWVRVCHLFKLALFASTHASGVAEHALQYLTHTCVGEQVVSSNAAKKPKWKYFPLQRHQE